MDDNIKNKMVSVINQYVSNIKQIENDLQRFPDSEEAIKDLVQAKYNLLGAQHKIKWIGISDKKEVQKEVLQDTDEDNPSA